LTLRNLLAFKIFHETVDGLQVRECAFELTIHALNNTGQVAYALPGKELVLAPLHPVIQRGQDDERVGCFVHQAASFQRASNGRRNLGPGH